MHSKNLRKRVLEASSALQVLAFAGAGAGLLAVGAAPAAAQDYTRGNLVGTIVDDAGAPVAGAEVRVTSNEQGFTNTTTTDSSGSFRVTALPTGSYTVVVTSGGQTVVEDRGANVVAGQNANYRYVAASGPTAVSDDYAGDAIVVTGTRVIANDFQSTQTGLTLNVQDLAESVPVGRDLDSLIQLAPGTVAGDTGFGNLTSISGATVAENAYYVNGMNITNFRNFLGGSIIPFEFYRTLDVKTGGYPAEYGRALGGVTSAVTKSGSNEFEAGAVINYNPNFLRSTSPNTFTDEDSNPTTQGDIVLALNEDDYSNSIDAAFYLSGPIIKDRLFFYGLYQPRYIETGSTTFSNALRTRSTNDSPFFGGKVDFVIANGHRLEGTYWSDKQTRETDYLVYENGRLPNSDPNRIGEIVGKRGTVVNQFGGDNYILTYTGSFTDFLTLSASYGRNKDKSIQFASPDRQYALTRIGPTRDAYGTVIGDVQDRNDRKFYRADADLYFSALGEHHIRAGFDYEDLTAGELTQYTGDGYRYDFRTTETRRRYYFNEGEFNTKMQAFYIQDAWSLMDDRLNLQLGLRADKFKNYTQNGDLYYDSGYNIGPRIGGSFDVFGDGATKINAFWGRYYLPIATNTNIRLAGAETYIQQRMRYSTAGVSGADANNDGVPDFFTFDENGNITNFVGNLGGACPDGIPNINGVCSNIFADGTLGAVDTLVNSSLKPSSTDEWLIGASHRMGDWTVSLNYINRRLGETLEDVAIDAAVNQYCDDNGIDCTTSSGSPIWSGFHQYVLTNPGEDMTVRLDGDCDYNPDTCQVVTLSAAALGYPKAVRKYDAVQFELEKAFNGLYGFTFNYTYTKLRGNFEGGVKSDNNQSDTGLTQDFDQPGFLDGAYGDLANGRRHSFKLFGHVQPTEWLDLGFNAVVESPRKFSCIGNYKNDSSTFEYSYGSASYYCRQAQFGGDGLPNGIADGDGTGSVLVPRGAAFKSEWNKSLDLGVKLMPFAENRDVFFRVDVFNVFNWKQELDYNEFGDIDYGGANPNYGKVRGYQRPRSVRLNWTMRFGGGR